MKKTGSIYVPDWASFFDSSEYDLFIKQIDNFFRGLNVKYEIAAGQVLLEGENEFGCSSLGLINVAQVCKQNRAGHYKKIIREHFSAMIKSNRFDKEFEEIADNFEEAKKYLGVRLYDNEYVAIVGKEKTIGKDIAGDIYATVVFDFPHSVVSVDRERTTAWSKTDKDIFSTGIENIRTKYPFKISKEAFGEFNIWFKN